MQHFKVIFTGKNGARRSRKFIELHASTIVGSIGNGGTRCEDPLKSALEFWLTTSPAQNAKVFYWDTQNPVQKKWFRHIGEDNAEHECKK